MLTLKNIQVLIYHVAICLKNQPAQLMAIVMKRLPFKRAFLLAVGLQLAVSSPFSSAAAQPRFNPGELVFSGVVPEQYFASIKKYYGRSKLTVVSVPPGQEISAAKRAKEDGFIASLNYIATASQATVPNDTYFPYQWNLSQMGVPSIWDISTGAGVKVAVVDTGLAAGSDGVNRCTTPNGYDYAYGDSDPDDKNGHGTHVSGTIAAITNNNKGVAGLAPDACVFPVKALDNRGSGSFTWIAEAVYYAVDKGADVISMSLGAQGISTSSIMDPALAYAEDHGVLVVAAAGNDGDVTTISYPAINPTVLSVGATGYDKIRAGYSNGGPQLDVVAPGGDTSEDLNHDGYGDGILQETFSRRNWGYYFYQGTSMATPHVAAVGALVRSKDATASPDTIRTRLRETATDLGPTGHDNEYGYGLVNPIAALNSTSTGTGGGTVTDPVNQSPVAAFTFGCTDLICSFDGSVSSDPDGDTLTFSWDFGDGSASTSQKPYHSYTSEGGYLVTLTVSDGALSSEDLQTVTVSAPAVSDINLTATGTKKRGVMTANLSWTPSDLSVDVYRDGARIDSGITSGTYQDVLGKGSGSFLYMVCKPTLNGDICSNAIQLVF